MQLCRANRGRLRPDEPRADRDQVRKYFLIHHKIFSIVSPSARIVTPVIISDQVGLSRATTAAVIACLFKVTNIFLCVKYFLSPVLCLFQEFQITASFDGLLHTVPGVHEGILKMDNYVSLV